MDESQLLRSAEFPSGFIGAFWPILGCIGWTAWYYRRQFMWLLVTPKRRRTNSYADLCHQLLKRSIVDIVAARGGCSTIIPDHNHFSAVAVTWGIPRPPRSFFQRNSPTHIYTPPITRNCGGSNRRHGIKIFISHCGRLWQLKAARARFPPPYATDILIEKHTPILISLKYPSGAHSCNMYSDESGDERELGMSSLAFVL